MCHTFVTLAIAALAYNEVAIFEMEQCRKKRVSLHMDFLMFEKRAVFSSFSLAGSGLGARIGQGMRGGDSQSRAAWRGRPAAMKSPRHDGPLGYYAGSAAEIQREIEVAMLVPSHPCLCRLIGWLAGPQALCGSLSERSKDERCVVAAWGMQPGWGPFFLRRCPGTPRSACVALV